MFLIDKFFSILISILLSIVVILLFYMKIIDLTLCVVLISLIFLTTYFVKLIQIDNYLKSIQNSLMEIASNTKRSDK